MLQKYKQFHRSVVQLQEQQKSQGPKTIELLNKHILEPRKRRPPSVSYTSRLDLSDILEEARPYHPLTLLFEQLYASRCNSKQQKQNPQQKRVFLTNVSKKNHVHNNAKLDLSGCELTTAESSIIQRHLNTELTRINLTDNLLCLQNIPSLFNPSLTELILCNCGLNNKALNFLFKNLETTPLFRLCLSSKGAGNKNQLNSDLSALISYLTKTSTLAILELASCKIPPDHKQLFEALSKSTVVSIDFSFNPKVQGSFKKLQKLNLQHNGLQKLSDVDVSQNCSLVYADLSFNNLAPMQFTRFFQNKSSSGLQTLICDQNPLVKDISYFGNFISETNSLKILSMKKCRLPQESIKALLEAIDSNTRSLAEVDFSGNSMTQENVKLLAKLLGNNSTVKQFRFSDCQISDEGGKRLALGLRYNRQLLNLDLSSNRLSIGAGESFCKILIINKTLSKLDLSKNTLTYSQLKEVEECLEHNKRLRRSEIKQQLETRYKEIQITPQEYKNTRKRALLHSQIEALTAIEEEIIDKCDKMARYQSNQQKTDEQYSAKLTQVCKQIGELRLKADGIALVTMPSITRENSTGQGLISHRSQSISSSRGLMRSQTRLDTGSPQPSARRYVTSFTRL